MKTKTVDSARIYLHSAKNKVYLAEASDLGLKPGEWPEEIRAFDLVFRRGERNMDGGYTYGSLGLYDAVIIVTND